MMSPSERPGCRIVRANGYRLTTTRSMSPPAPTDRTWAGSSRRARMPAGTLGGGGGGGRGGGGGGRRGGAGALKKTGGIGEGSVIGFQTCALPIYESPGADSPHMGGIVPPRKDAGVNLGV